MRTERYYDFIRAAGGETPMHRALGVALPLPSEKLVHVIRPSKDGLGASGIRTLCGIGQADRVWRINAHGAEHNVIATDWAVCVECVMRRNTWIRSRSGAFREKGEMFEKKQPRQIVTLAEEPRGFRDLYWCYFLNEPVFSTWLPGASKREDAACPHCKTKIVDAPEQHVFIGHVPKPDFAKLDEVPSLGHTRNRNGVLPIGDERPTAEECSEKKIVREDADHCVLATWHPQWGGYASMAEVRFSKVSSDGRGEHIGCIDVLNWHDGEFPTKEPHQTTRYHYCSAEQIVDFGLTIIEAQLGRQISMLDPTKKVGVDPKWTKETIMRLEKILHPLFVVTIDQKA